ncbi:MAG: glycosyltransferase family 4 protein [Desulfovibrio sp.]|nr:glycosyltransferase family 4 protein [Desulfovibrio sp.]
MTFPFSSSPPSNLSPHLAYIALWYPLFTQPFIFSEVENLRDRLPLKVYSLYGENLRHCSREMLAAKDRVKRHGLKALLPILADFGAASGHSPRLVAGLARDVLLRKWPSLEVFGENLWGFLAGVSLGKQFKEDGIDMAYAPWPRGAATAAMIGAKLAGIPFGLSARGDNLDPADPDLRYKFGQAAFIRANNHADQRRIAQFADVDAKTFLVYNGLAMRPPIAPPRRFGEKTTRLLAVGRFDVTKGFDILLDACAILARNGVDFKLTLAGGGGKVMGLGNLENDLRARRKRLDLENVVEMPGLVSHDELPGLLASHDIFAAPCVIHSSGRRDGIPNTVIEALSAGMPVVSSNINALPEVIIDGETGLAVPPNDPEALAGALLAMIRDPARALKMGENGAELAKSMFDPRTNAQNLAENFIRAYKKTKAK